MSASSNHPDLDDLDARIEQWVADLDSDSDEVAESAQHGLARLGPRVLDRVIAAVPGLARFGQAVLYFQLWQILPDGRATWHASPQIDWAIDRDLAWSQIVTDCRDWAQLAATAIPPHTDVVATVEWIAANDL